MVDYNCRKPMKAQPPATDTRGQQVVKPFLLAFAVALPLTAATSSAKVAFDFAAVGNPGNEADPATGFGAVPYAFAISRTEVSNAQYAEFLNAIGLSQALVLGLYSPFMDDQFGGIDLVAGNYVTIPGRENHPVSIVSWYDAVRFVNWLHNGQGTGDTETGAYTLLGGGETPTNGNSITRNPGARFWLPSRDEWYKAAHHDASSGTAPDYFLYANGSNDPPVSDRPSDNPAGANFFHDDGVPNGFDDGLAVSGTIELPAGASPYTNVGAFTETKSAYGAFDMNGNVNEWNETYIPNGFRSFQGGYWRDLREGLAASSYRGYGPTNQNAFTGFRLATVPETATFTLLCLAVGSMLATCRRSRVHR